ncbi:MAG: hypothetical protein J5930_06375 [Treponema sp.]|nr:hypothetical protein [Treponema sp.]MBO5607506.1 hypothetical protein [Treponema sp.]
MSVKKNIRNALLLLIFSLPVYAESGFFDNYVYRMWNSFGGLSGTTATDIAQTSDGFINVGTYEGLVRFDGVEFTTVKKASTNDFQFASVRAVLEDSRGNLWLGSNDEGLQKISEDGNKCYTVKSGLPNNSVRALAEDKDGNVWIGTAAGIVYLTPDGKMLTPQFESGTVPKGVIAISLFCDSSGNIWLVTSNEKGLFVFKDGLFRIRTELDKFGTYFVSSFSQDLQGTYWAGLNTLGIARLKNGKAELVHTGTILDTSPTWAIHVEKDGSIWFGTERGVVVYSGGSFHEYKEMSQTITKINKIISDREGNLWMATDHNGIVKITQGKFNVTNYGIASNAITEGQDGKIWVGTDLGVRCYENGNEIKNELTEYTEGLRIRHMATASNGDILVSCYTSPGQLRYGKEGIKSWTAEDGLTGNKVRVAIEAESGELYVGTTTGLSIIHADGSIKNFRQIDGLENEYVMCIYQDLNGVVWVGTDGGGIYLFKDEKIIGVYTTEQGLAGNIVFKISQDKDGSYWLCTGSGLSYFPQYDSTQGIPAKAVTLNSEQGLGTDSVFQFFPDKDGNVWFTSNYGIASAVFSEIKDVAEGRSEKVNVKYYNRNDGLDSDGPTSTAVSICDRNGKLWFTLIDGIAVYDALLRNSSPVMPLVSIESVTVDHKEYKDECENIVLKPGTKRVEIKFTGISFDAPERIRFTHKMTNFEDDFSAPSSARTVSYTNLKPGKHTFYVNAINGEGLMSDQAESTIFIQKPYIYQMPQFWVVIAVVAMTSIFVFFYLKERAMRRENIRLEKMVRERTSQLAHEKEKSDRLLRSILPDKIAEILKDDIHSIGENFSDATILFSDIVSFTKTSSGHTAEEIVSALNKLFSLFDDRAKAMGVEKIKTIGDAYMAACGLPTKNPDHAKVMVDFAKGMFEDLAEYNKTAKIPFNMRIGINCGPVNAGVIGKTKFVYDVWGNTVNVASRMETACNPGKIRVSQSVYEHLKDSGVKFSESIQCDVKGKGLMTTYEIV